MSPNKKESNWRAPTPYECTRDFLEISSSIILTIAIVVLMILQLGIFPDVIKYALLLLIVIPLVFVIYRMITFYIHWVKWVKKK
jgi:glucan phosphoethanolaminetransferase (alkaline phosphatase superfamily)